MQDHDFRSGLKTRIVKDNDLYIAINLTILYNSLYRHGGLYISNFCSKKKRHTCPENGNQCEICAESGRLVEDQDKRSVQMSASAKSRQEICAQTRGVKDVARNTVS